MPEPKVTGKYVEAFLMSAGEVSPVFERKARDFLRENGFEDIESDRWYPMTQFTDAMNDIEEAVGTMSSRQAGIKMIEVSEEISDMESLEAAVELGAEVTQQAYKHYSPERVGQMRYETTENGRDRLVYYGDWQFPEEFTRGIFVGLTRATRGFESATVEPTETQPGEAYAFVVES